MGLRKRASSHFCFFLAAGRLDFCSAERSHRNARACSKECLMNYLAHGLYFRTRLTADGAVCCSCAANISMGGHARGKKRG